MLQDVTVVTTTIGQVPHVRYHIRQAENENVQSGVGWGVYTQATPQLPSTPLYSLAVKMRLLNEVTLPLPRVINFKFLLQPHKKYYITQYGELGFSQVTQMNHDFFTNSHYFTYTFRFKRLGECNFLILGVSSTWRPRSYHNAGTISRILML